MGFAAFRVPPPKPNPSTPSPRDLNTHLLKLYIDNNINLFHVGTILVCFISVGTKQDRSSAKIEQSAREGQESTHDQTPCQENEKYEQENAEILRRRGQPSESGKGEGRSRRIVRNIMIVLLYKLLIST